MPIEFFTIELRKVQDRFNQTFGTMTVCNIRTRNQTMLAIVGLGLIKRRITKTHDRKDIQKFMKTKTILHNIFNSIERSNHVEHTNKRKTGNHPKALRN